MAEYLPKLWTLAEAILTGGAQLAIADSPLPARVMPGDGNQLEAILSASHGVAWDANNTHVWANTTSGVRKYLPSSVTPLATFINNSTVGGTRTVVTPQGLTRGVASSGVFGNKLHFAGSGAGNFIAEVDTAALTCQVYSQATVTAPYHVVMAEAGKVWVRTGATTTGTYTEFTLSGSGDAAVATPTGRTMPGGPHYDMAADALGNVFMVTSANIINKVRLSDLVTIATLTPPGSVVTQLPGYGTWRACAYDAVRGRLYFGNNVSFGDSWHSATSALIFEDRAFSQIEHSGFAAGQSTVTHRTPIAFSDDGTKVAFTCLATGAATITSVMVKNLAIENARWEWTPGVVGTLETIAVPGDLAARSGKIPFMPAVTSLRTHKVYKPARVYYQIGAAARVEYFGGVIGAAITAADKVGVEVDFQFALDDYFGPRPWVADGAGAGPSAVVSWTPAVTADYIEVPGGRSRLRAAGGAARVRAR